MDELHLSAGEKNTSPASSTSRSARGDVNDEIYGNTEGDLSDFSRTVTPDSSSSVEKNVLVMIGTSPCIASLSLVLCVEYF